MEGADIIKPLAAMGIAAVMILGLLEILERELGNESGQPEMPTVTSLSYDIMVTATAVTLALAAWERHRGRELSRTRFTPMPSPSTDNCSCRGTGLIREDLPLVVRFLPGLSSVTAIAAA